MSKVSEKNPGLFKKIRFVYVEKRLGQSLKRTARLGGSYFPKAKFIDETIPTLVSPYGNKNKLNVSFTQGISFLVYAYQAKISRVFVQMSIQKTVNLTGVYYSLQTQYFPQAKSVGEVLAPFGASIELGNTEEKEDSNNQE